MYGNPETTTGGKALKFYASVRIDIRRAEAIGTGSNIQGNIVKIKIVKNKVAPPFKTCMVDIIYGKGISKYGELLDLGVQFEIVSKTGNWYEYDGNRIGNGRENSKLYLEGHPEISDEIEKKVIDKLNANNEK